MRPRHIRAEASSSTRKPIEMMRSTPSPMTFSWGTIELAAVALEAGQAALDTEHARDGEPPDVGVEHPDGEPSGGHGRGQVHRDRGLAHPALARGDQDDLGGGADGGVLVALGDVEPGLGHGRGLLLGGHLGPLQADVGDPGDRPQAGADVTLDLGPQRAARGGEGDGDRDPALVVGAGRRATMPRSTMSLPSSGSITPRSRPRSSSRSTRGPSAPPAVEAGVGGTGGILPGWPGRTPGVTG